VAGKDYQIGGEDYQVQATGEDYQNDQWSPWSKCNQGQKMKQRCRGDECEALSCNPPTFGPGGDYQIQAQGEDYQNEERHRGCPKKQPKMGSVCYMPDYRNCSYGRECCCGKCHPSFVASCTGRNPADIPLHGGMPVWRGFNTDACMRPNCGKRDCPKKEPRMGSPCSVPEDVTCTYGRECCCGKCHPSFEASCDPKYGWMGFNTDACMMPNCEKAACPKKQPRMGSPCSVPEDVTCTWGRECCCGKCFPSFEASCDPKYGWMGFNTDACMMPNCEKAACPKKEPTMGSPCSVSESVTCTYGRECCCGKCFPSFKASCDGKYGWSGFFTDACLNNKCFYPKKY